MENFTTVGKHCKRKRGEKHELVGCFVDINLSSLGIKQKLRTMNDTVSKIEPWRLAPLPELAPAGSCFRLPPVVTPLTGLK